MGLRDVRTEGVDDRFLAVDERGTGLRATWRSAHGFVNVSLWRGQFCVETFHLSPLETGRLIGFLATALTGAVPPEGSRSLRLVGGDDAVPAENRTGTLRTVRDRMAESLEGAARRLRA